MAIDFPASPTLNDVFTVGNVTYVWDGTKWTASVTGGISLDKIEEGNTSAEVIDTGSDGRFVVTTEGTGRLFVDASGNVGVGLSSIPNYNANLRTVSFNNTNGVVHDYAVNGTRTGSIVCQSTGFDLTTQTNIPLIFSTNSNERMRITSAGLVGIGTSSLAYETLTVQSSSADVVAKFAGPTDPATWIQFTDNTTSDQAVMIGCIGNDLRLRAGSAERMRIDSSGNVGIGTTSPRRTLEVSGADGYLCLNATNTSTGTSQLLFGDTDDDNIGRIYYDHGTDNMAFWTNTSEKARIDTSGRLLVGTSSSAAGGSRLQIEGTGYYESSASFRRNSNDASAPALRLNKSRGTSTGSYTAVQNGDVLGLVQFSGSDGTDDETGAQIACEVDGTPGANDMPGRLVFSTTADGASSPGEAMRISSGKNVLLSGCAGDTLNVTNTSGAGTTNTFIVGRYSNSAGTTDGTISLLVYTNGNVQNTNNSYGAISDLKLKENIVDANSQWNDLKSLQVRNYNFKEGQTHTQIGLIAQEVELVSPGLVSESPDRDEDGNDLGTVTKSVNYSVLYMKAVKALQEAMERIETLEGMVAVNNITIDEQQHQLSTLAARLTALETP
jgi:hypothetical protein